MAGYTKLASSILTSTIWVEDTDTRIVWFTLLALANKDGEVEGSIPGLASIARVPVEACRAAMAKFLAPDADSRTKDDEGRRVELIDGGWLLLNYTKYRERASDDDRRQQAAQRQQRVRARQARNAPENAIVTPPSRSVTQSHAESRSVTLKSRQIPQAEAEAEAEAEAKAETKNTTTPAASRGAAPLIVSPLAYARLKERHAFVGARLRVPNGLHDELRNALGVDGETRLQGWYLGLDDALEASQEPIGDIYKFLRPRYAAWATPAAPAAVKQRAGLPVPENLFAALDVVAEATRHRARREQMLADGMTIDAIEQLFDAEYDARRSARAGVEGVA